MFVLEGCVSLMWRRSFGIQVVMLLVKVEVQVGSCCEQPIDSCFIQFSAIDIQRTERFIGDHVIDDRIGNGNVDDVQELDRFAFQDLANPSVRDFWRTKSK